MATQNVNVGFVPRAGIHPGIAGTATAVDTTYVASLFATKNRDKAGDALEFRQKQRDKDRIARGY